MPNNHLTKIRLFTALFSLLLSWLAIYTDDLINPDGILYMKMAEAFLQGGLTETARLYDWPFFSILVAYLHKITTLPLQLSAHILNAVLFVLLTDTLILINSKTLVNSRQLTIAALFILCFISLNEYRDFVVRDIGYWAFCSLTLYRFILFLKLPTLTNATIWQITAILAILFRVEGVVILLGLSIFLFFNQPIKQAFKNTVKLNYLLITGITASSFIVIGQSGLANAFGKLMSIFIYIDIDTLSASLDEKIQIISTQILNKYSEEYSGLILISGLFVMLVYKLIKSLSIGYLGLYIASRWKNKDSLSFPYQTLLVYFVSLNLLILVVFMLKQYFIVTRYSVMALIGLMLIMLPHICRYLENSWQTKNRIVISIASVILLISLIDGVTQSNSKSFIKETAIWASQNLPAESKILTDDSFVIYYFNSHQPKASITIEDDIQDYQNYNYLIVVEKRKNTELKVQLKNMKIEPVYTLANKRTDKATVYQITNNHQ